MALAWLISPCWEIWPVLRWNLHRFTNSHSTVHPSSTFPLGQNDKTTPFHPPSIGWHREASRIRKKNYRYECASIISGRWCAILGAVVAFVRKNHQSDWYAWNKNDTFANLCWYPRGCGRQHFTANWNHTVYGPCSLAGDRQDAVAHVWKLNHRRNAQWCVTCHRTCRGEVKGLKNCVRDGQPTAKFSWVQSHNEWPDLWVLGWS